MGKKGEGLRAEGEGGPAGIGRGNKRKSDGEKLKNFIETQLPASVKKSRQNIKISEKE